MKRYYVFAFDGGAVVRTTRTKHTNVKDAITEVYGSICQCHYTTSPRKDEAHAVALGRMGAEWKEIVWGINGFKRQDANCFKLKRGGLVQ